MVCAYCTALTEVVLPEGLTTLSVGSFAGCTSLTEVILPESLLTIEEGVFKGCENLVIKTTLPYEEWPAGWVEGWHGNATVEVIEKTEEEEGEGEENEDGKENDDKENKERGRG